MLAGLRQQTRGSRRFELISRPNNSFATSSQTMLASTNKCLAKSNKSGAGGKATNERKNPDALSQCLD
jgi:hypothetical protein